MIVISRLPCQIINGEPCTKCFPAERIVDPLISSDSVALLRGNAYLDKHGYEYDSLKLDGVADANMTTGDLIEVNTGEGIVKGQLTSWSLDISVSDSEVNANSSYTVKTLR